MTGESGTSAVGSTARTSQRTPIVTHTAAVQHGKAGLNCTLMILCTGLLFTAGSVAVHRSDHHFRTPLPPGPKTLKTGAATTCVKAVRHTAGVLG